MSRDPVFLTEYGNYVYGKIDLWFQQGRAAFTLKELAAFAGLKITPSFRRRVNHCVHAGQLVCRSVPYETRGSCNVYYRPDMNQAEVTF